MFPRQAFHAPVQAFDAQDAQARGQSQRGEPCRQQQDRGQRHPERASKAGSGVIALARFAPGLLQHAGGLIRQRLGRLAGRRSGVARDDQEQHLAIELDLHTQARGQHRGPARARLLKGAFDALARTVGPLGCGKHAKRGAKHMDAAAADDERDGFFGLRCGQMDDVGEAKQEQPEEQGAQPGQADGLKS